MIVCADADLDRAARAAVWGAFLNAGQTCAAVERCYVERSVADAFLAKLKEHTQSLRLAGGAPGPEGDDDDVGPLIDAAQFTRVRELFDDALAGGARIFVGGENHEATLR